MLIYCSSLSFFPNLSHFVKILISMIMIITKLEKKFNYHNWNNIQSMLYYLFANTNQFAVVVSSFEKPFVLIRQLKSAATISSASSGPRNCIRCKAFRAYPFAGGPTYGTVNRLIFIREGENDGISFHYIHLSYDWKMVGLILFFSRKRSPFSKRTSLRWYAADWVGCPDLLHRAVRSHSNRRYIAHVQINTKEERIPWNSIHSLI